MMLSTTVDGLETLLTYLAGSAARSLALGIGAGLALAAFRVRSTSLRLFAWTGVLYAALALPFLGQIVPSLPIPTLAFLESNTAKTAEIAAQPHARALPSIAHSLPASQADSRAAQMISPGYRTSPGSTASSWFSWIAVAAGIYFSVAFILLTRIAVGMVFNRRLRKAVRTIHDPRVILELASRARASGLASLPQAAESHYISVPLTMGIFHPTILFPTGWQEWNDAKLTAVIAHEVSHIARRDALTQCLSLVHRAIFWFSPLAWWLDRHLAGLAEQASDEAALSCGADRSDYARTLLGFFEALQVAPERVWWQGVSMAKSGEAEQRVERILAWRGAVTMGVKKSIAILTAVIAIPVVFLAASVRPAGSSESAQSAAVPRAQRTTPAVPAADSAPPAADTEPDPALAPSAPAMPSGAAPVAAIAPSSPATLAQPAAAPFALAGQSHSSYSVGNSYTYGYDDDERFVIITGKSDSVTMSGSTSDVHHAEKLKKSISGDFIWFQRDEKSYIIRDQATVDRARKFWAPQEELGKKQEVLGKQQEELGRQEEAISKRMEEVQVQVPDMTASLDRLKAKLQKLGSTATMEQIGELQSEIGELQSKIGEVQSHAGDQQGKLGEEMGALGEKQGKLGELQGELGREQGELGEKAAQQMKQLLDEAITKGTAQPEEQIVKSPTL